MAKYKSYVGVTETADPGLHWKSLKKLHRSNVIITKHLENDEFKEWLLEHQNCIILHATITGWGGTEVEPGVQPWDEQLEHLMKLISMGFDPKHIVLRVDPIIPTSDGFSRAIEVIHKYALLYDNEANRGPVRVRTSMIDCYYHIRRKLKNVGIDTSLITDDKGFTVKEELFHKLNDYICILRKDYPHLEFEACTEKMLTSCEQIGCVSQKDIDILGLTDVVKLEGKTHQRQGCLCPNNKIQLTGTYWDIAKQKCESKCAYCYLKSNH